MKTSSILIIFFAIFQGISVFAQENPVLNTTEISDNFPFSKEKVTTIVELTLTNFQNSETLNVVLPYGNNLQILQNSSLSGSVSLLSVPGYTYLGYLPYTSPALTSNISYWCVWGGSYSCLVDVVIQTTDINENSDEISGNVFTVFPTLASDNIYIKSDSDSYFEIFDLNGRVVSKTYEKTINISDLKPGLYYVRNENSVKKFIKE